MRLGISMLDKFRNDLQFGKVVVSKKYIKSGEEQWFMLRDSTNEPRGIIFNKCLDLCKLK